MVLPAPYDAAVTLVRAVLLAVAVTKRACHYRHQAITACKPGQGGAGLFTRPLIPRGLKFPLAQCLPSQQQQLPVKLPPALLHHCPHGTVQFRKCCTIANPSPVQRGDLSMQTVKCKVESLC